MNKAVVMLDRDGTINARVRGGYLLSLEDIQRPIDLVSLRILKGLGIQLNIVTNQACISKRLIDVSSVRVLTREILAPVTTISDSQIFICSHQSFENCLCRKPGTKLILDSLAYNEVGPDSAFFIGDSPSDREAAHASGITFLGVCWDSECFGPECSHTLSGAVSEIVTILKSKEEQ